MSVCTKGKLKGHYVGLCSLLTTVGIGVGFLEQPDVVAGLAGEGKDRVGSKRLARQD
jgi:hypothetical protein